MSIRTDGHDEAIWRFSSLCAGTCSYETSSSDDSAVQLALCPLPVAHSYVDWRVQSGKNLSWVKEEEKQSSAALKERN